MTSEQDIKDFQEIVWNYYHNYGRHDLPWRQPRIDDTYDPYKIMVSELMLQQTQVNRVIPKFHQFLERFPTLQSLAAAELSEVLQMWNGLGYNRRAKYLLQAARMINSDYGGKFPSDTANLVLLPGIGKNTAGAIAAYAFNQPVVFIETNIRTVIIYHFLMDQDAITDTAVADLLLQSIDSDNPREWYWALMDYGTP